MLKRRALITAPLIAAPLLVLSACGFELRRAPELRFRTIHLTGFKPRTPVGEGVKRFVAWYREYYKA